MNHTSRCIDAFAARPLSLEISRSFGASSAGMSLLVAMALPLAALAEPKGGSVVAGQAAISNAGTTTTINQTSQRAAIDWRSFSVARNETVHFQQPNANSSTLNRVVGNDASAILGRITANGTVLLVNPNGILFGRTAQVDVGGLVASTANIATADFMAGRLAFSGTGKPGATVENQGTITIGQGGLAALVGRGVSNSGVINARLGKVSLAAGDAFVLDLYGDKLVNLIVDPTVMQTMTDASGTPLAARVDHSGKITAEGGIVQLTAATVKQMVDNVINVSGVIRATSFDTAPGVISLRGDSNTQLALSGTLDAAGTRGGRIEATARDVRLTETARVDASGATAGGVVAIGGDWQGRGALPNAQDVAIARGATIDAGSIGSGHGGTVSVWADGNTRFEGAIASRGGAAGGDGGMVEVSGKARLAFDGDVDAKASAGRAGSLLLDPTNIVVSAGAGGALPGSSDAGDFTVGVDNVRRVLLTGTTVNMTASNDIAVNAAVDGRSTVGGVAGGGLRVEAGRNIFLNQNVILNNGDLAVSAGGSLVQSSNSVLFTGTGNMSLQGGAGVQLGQLVTNGGAVTIASSLGPVVVDAPIVGTGSTGRAGMLTVEGKGITLNGGRVGDFTLRNGNAARALQLVGTLDATGAGRVWSAGAVSLTDVKAAGFTLGGVAGDGSAADNLTLSGTLTSNAPVDLRTVNGMTLTTTGAVNADGTLRMLAGGVLDTASGSAIVAGGPANITAAALRLNGGLQAGGTDNTVVTATAGGVTLGDKAVVKVVGSGALAFEGNGFAQAEGAKVQSGIGGAAIRAGNGNVNASSLVSTGAVSLSGADVSVSQFIGGPGTAPASALTVESAGQTMLAGGRFSGAVDITAVTPSTATRGGIVFTGPLSAGGAVRLATDGDTSLQAVKAASIDLADTLASTTGHSGGDLALRGDIDSAGRTRFGLRGAFSTDANVKVVSAGDLGIDAASILVRGGSGVGVSADFAGLKVSDASTMTLIADGGDVATAADPVRPALLAEGSLRTEGGDLTLRTTGSGSIRLAQVQTIASRPDDATQPRSSLNGTLAIESVQGGVVLSEALGGNLTGYANYADGYVARNRPLVGAVNIAAATGIETNGLNIDGPQAAGTGGIGEPKGLTMRLTSATPGVIIVNKTLAVNKGAIDINAGSGDVLIGASIFSRGYDVAEADRTAASAPPAADSTNNIKVAYPITITGKKLAFWDADQGVAVLPMDDPVRNRPIRFHPITRLPLPSWIVSKITVANNAANYTDVDNTNTLVPVRSAEGPKVTLDGVFEGLDTPANSRIHLGGVLPIRISLSLVPNLASPPDSIEPETEGKGVAVKVLTFTHTDKDVSSNVTDATPKCASNGNGDCSDSGADFDLRLSSVQLGVARGVDVNQKELEPKIESSFRFEPYIVDPPPAPGNPQDSETKSGTYGGQASLYDVLVAVSSDIKARGSQVLYFPGILASNKRVVATFLTTGGNNDISGRTALPSNSSFTSYDAVGSFGNSRPQSFVAIAGSNVDALPTGVQFGLAEIPGVSGLVGGIAGVPEFDGAIPGTLRPVAEIQSETTRQDLQTLLGPLNRLVSRADLGRGGALGGATATVFGQRVFLGTSNDPKVCAPADFAAQGAAADTCKPPL